LRATRVYNSVIEEINEKVNLVFTGFDQKSEIRNQTSKTKNQKQKIKHQTSEIVQNVIYVPYHILLYHNHTIPYPGRIRSYYHIVS